MSRAPWFAWMLPFVVACGDDPPGGGPPPGDQTGQACASVTQCYPGIDPPTLSGTVECLTKVQGGYCTHQCTADSDCCAVPGECLTALREVCSPLTNEQTPTRCFISCEADDLARAGYTSDAAFCQYYANPNFNCRASGGGAPRKICLP